jgi:TatD DNase family protein
MWTDAHCHIPHAAGDGRFALDEQAVADAHAAGVERMITVGTDVATSAEGIAVAGRHEGVWATVGLHPHDAVQGLDGLEALLGSPEVVAVGECGLDLTTSTRPDPSSGRCSPRRSPWRPPRTSPSSSTPVPPGTRPSTSSPPRACRSAPCSTASAAARERPGGRSTPAPCLSFSGIVTFPSAGDVRAAAALCPLDRLTVETDAPYLAPVPHRGRSNTPALLPLVGAAVAAAKGVDVEVVADASSETAARLFRLPPASPSS